MTALSERAAPVTAEFTLSSGAAAPVLEIDESAWVGITHRNKFGEEYPASAYDPARRKH